MGRKSIDFWFSSLIKEWYKGFTERCENEEEREKDNVEENLWLDVENSRNSQLYPQIVCSGFAFEDSVSQTSLFKKFHWKEILLVFLFKLIWEKHFVVFDFFPDSEFLHEVLKISFHDLKKQQKPKSSQKIWRNKGRIIYLIFSRMFPLSSALKNLREWLFEFQSLIAIIWRKNSMFRKRDLL